MTNLNKTMDEVAELHKSHGVRQKGGKLYTQVVHRMEAFRKQHGTEFGVDTSILVNDGQKVVVKAIITDKDSRIVGAGMAEEIRGQGLVNTTSALENAETSAVGRALAMLGLTNDNIASAEEVSQAIASQDKALNKALTELDKVSHLGSYKAWISKHSDLFKKIKINNPLAYQKFQEDFSKIRKTMEAKGVITNGGSTTN